MGMPKSYHVLDLFALPPGCAKMEEEDRRKLVFPTQPRRTALNPKTCSVPIFWSKGDFPSRGRKTRLTPLTPTERPLLVPYCAM